jgi:hypothetical protein
VARASIFLIAIALIVAMAGCVNPPPFPTCDLTIASMAGGSVTTPGEGTFTYPLGETVKLVAMADEGYRFVEWTGNVSTIADVEAATTTINMEYYYSITANFAPEALEIQTWYDLDDIRDNLDGSYVLMNNLDSTIAGYEELAGPTANGGKGWQPIGSTSGSLPDEFVGTLDGGGYEICDLFINRPDEFDVGLFGIVYFGGGITNLGVVNATVIGHMWVGGLVALSVGTVINSYSVSNVNGTNYVGGLVGASGDPGTVSNSYSIGNVTGDGVVGGLVGGNGGIVSECHSASSVISEEGFVGGLVGWNQGTVSNSYATGSVSVTGTTAGGLVGKNNYDGTVSNSYSTGSVTGEAKTGGLMGINWGTVSNSYSTGSVTGNDYTGGLVGVNTEGTVSNSFWDTETSGLSTSAGGTGKTTAQMQNIATFSGASWDIFAVVNPSERNPEYIWNIVNNETYAFLSWQS